MEFFPDSFGMVSIVPPTQDPAGLLDGKRILLLSAYDAASHQHWRQQLVTMFPRCHWTVLTLPARYFSWRIRGNSMSWAFNHRRELTDNHDLLIATSVCDLASLRGFVPELGRIPALVYFHENQLAYPESGKQHPSVEPAMVNLYSALSADRVAFNSEWNRRSFLDGVRALLRRLPDAVPGGLVDLLEAKSVVLPVPLPDSLFETAEFLKSDTGKASGDSDTPLIHPWRLVSPIPGLQRSASPEAFPAPPAQHSDVVDSFASAAQQPINIIWNHRQEHDKGPDRLLHLTQALIRHQLRFRLHLLGQRFRQRPAAFDQIEQLLADYYATQGIEPGINRFIDDRQQYEAILRSSDIVLSTADHDFQGLSMLEAAALGCTAIAPDALAYPEYLPAKGLYPVQGLSLEQQAEAAADLIADYALKASGRTKTRSVPATVLALKASNLTPQWQRCLEELAKR